MTKYDILKGIRVYQKGEKVNNMIYTENHRRRNDLTDI